MSSLKKIEKKIQTIEQGKNTVQDWISKNETIVFTNGCFDILHLGHLDYLCKAKDLGSKLIVGVNSSNSVKKLKGPSRPVNSTQSRSKLLAGFECIDLIVVFNEDTPLNLIQSLKPNILVKGGDYTFETIVGAEEVKNYGGQVEIIPFLPGYSTSKIVTKIQSFSKS
ncbi:MAG: D-glycero-beta-D-manno-heptose 1-phosphate adenylyltransferase [Flavobacteriales bacterium]